MRNVAIYLIICLGLLFCVSCAEQTSSLYRGHQVWRVEPASSYVLNFLKEIGNTFQLDFWKDPVGIGRPVDFRVSPEQRLPLAKAFKSRGISDYRVYIKDIQDLIDEEKHSAKGTEPRSIPKSVASFDYSKYHTAEEVYEWMDMVVEEYPTVATKTQIGVTYQGRPMYVLEFKKRPPLSPKPVIFVDALIHCREWITTASLLFIFKEMLRNPEYAHMLDEADWYFVPMINIDGYEETWNGDRLWRKTRSSGPSSACVGIDGNRNWDAFWSSPGASPLPCSIIYHGPTPSSEAEIRNLRDYVLGLGKGFIDAYISTHSYSQLILYAYHNTATPSKDDAALNQTGKLMSDAIRAVHGKEYVYGPGATTIYVSSGTTTDWTYEVAKIVQSHTYELRDTGQNGFILPADQIIPNGEEYLEGLAALKNYVVANFDGMPSGDGM